jgi:hypothetical protein
MPNDWDKESSHMRLVGCTESTFRMLVWFCLLLSFLVLLLVGGSLGSGLSFPALMKLHLVLLTITRRFFVLQSPP